MTTRLVASGAVRGAAPEAPPARTNASVVAAAHKQPQAPAPGATRPPLSPRSRSPRSHATVPVGGSLSSPGQGSPHATRPPPRAAPFAPPPAAAAPASPAGDGGATTGTAVQAAQAPAPEPPLVVDTSAPRTRGDNRGPPVTAARPSRSGGSSNRSHSITTSRRSTKTKSPRARDPHGSGPGSGSGSASGGDSLSDSEVKVQVWKPTPTFVPKVVTHEERRAKRQRHKKRSHARAAQSSVMRGFAAMATAPAQLRLTKTAHSASFNAGSGVVSAARYGPAPPSPSTAHTAQLIDLDSDGMVDAVVTVDDEAEPYRSPARPAGYRQSPRRPLRIKSVREVEETQAQRDAAKALEVSSAAVAHGHGGRPPTLGEMRRNREEQRRAESHELNAALGLSGGWSDGAGGLGMTARFHWHSGGTSVRHLDFKGRSSGTSAMDDVVEGTSAAAATGHKSVDWRRANGRGAPARGDSDTRGVRRRRNSKVLSMPTAGVKSYGSSRAFGRMAQARSGNALASQSHYRDAGVGRTQVERDSRLQATLLRAKMVVERQRDPSDGFPYHSPVKRSHTFSGPIGRGGNAASGSTVHSDALDAYDADADATGDETTDDERSPMHRRGSSRRSLHSLPRRAQRQSTVTRVRVMGPQESRRRGLVLPFATMSEAPMLVPTVNDIAVESFARDVRALSGVMSITSSSRASITTDVATSSGDATSPMVVSVTPQDVPAQLNSLPASLSPSASASLSPTRPSPAVGDVPGLDLSRIVAVNAAAPEVQSSPSPAINVAAVTAAAGASVDAARPAVKIGTPLITGFRVRQPHAPHSLMMSPRRRAFLESLYQSIHGRSMDDAIGSTEAATYSKAKPKGASQERGKGGGAAARRRRRRRRRRGDVQPGAADDADADRESDTDADKSAAAARDHVKRTRLRRRRRSTAQVERDAQAAKRREAHRTGPVLHERGPKRNASIDGPKAAPTSRAFVRDARAAMQAASVSHSDTSGSDSDTKSMVSLGSTHSLLSAGSTKSVGSGGSSVASKGLGSGRNSPSIAKLALTNRLWRLSAEKGTLVPASLGAGGAAALLSGSQTERIGVAIRGPSLTLSRSASMKLATGADDDNGGFSRSASVSGRLRSASLSSSPLGARNDRGGPPMPVVPPPVQFEFAVAGDDSVPGGGTSPLHKQVFSRSGSVMSIGSAGSGAAPPVRREVRPLGGRPTPSRVVGFSAATSGGAVSPVKGVALTGISPTRPPRPPIVTGHRNSGPARSPIKNGPANDKAHAAEPAAMAQWGDATSPLHAGTAELDAGAPTAARRHDSGTDSNIDPRRMLARADSKTLRRQLSNRSKHIAHDASLPTKVRLAVSDYDERSQASARHLAMEVVAPGATIGMDARDVRGPITTPDREDGGRGSHAVAPRGSLASGQASPEAAARRAELMAFTSPGLYGFSLDGSALASTVSARGLDPALRVSPFNRTPRPSATVDADVRELSVPLRSRLAGEKKRGSGGAFGLADPVSLALDTDAARKAQQERLLAEALADATSP